MGYVSDGLEFYCIEADLGARSLGIQPLSSGSRQEGVVLRCGMRRNILPARKRNGFRAPWCHRTRI